MRSDNNLKLYDNRVNNKDAEVA